MLKQRILFICTANYYRSRFAEGLFNGMVSHRGLPWCAFSRALALDQLVIVAGHISHYAQIALLSREIPLSMTGRFPRDLRAYDLQSADKIIALKEDEHRPLMEKRFPFWADKIEYWDIGDIDRVEPQEALPYLASQIEALVCELET